jgi:hypothetical protein
MCRTLLISLAVQAAPEGTFWCGGVIMPRTLPLSTDSSMPHMARQVSHEAAPLAAAVLDRQAPRPARL